jgi:NAD(P)-dependent dehydrogenase (short-subunit alcohol dehydrogenase family)
MTHHLFSLSGRTALVTGASSGIGAHLAAALAKAGARVAVAARRQQQLDQVAAEICTAGGEAFAVKLDVADAASIEQAFDTIEAHWGTVDLLINNAGIADPKRFLEVSVADFDQLTHINYRGAWLVAQQACRRMVAAERPGSIVNLASILGLGVHHGQASYSASKAAIIQLTKALAHEMMPYHIRVNAIAPGWFGTEMNASFFNTESGRKIIASSPPGRAGELDELVGPVLLLASEAGSYVNGVVLAVDGGHHSKLA